MRAPLTCLLFALFAAGCSKCGEAPKITESTHVVSPKSTANSGVGDLRSGLINTVPEFRGVNNLKIIAVLERTLAEDPAHGGDLTAALQPLFKDKRWVATQIDAGALIAQQKPYFLEADRINGEVVLRVGLVIPGEQVVSILQTPAPLTSQQLALLMPLPANTKVKSDLFVFEAHYFATDKLGTMLIKELIAADVKSGWKLEEAPRQLFDQDSGFVASGFKAVLSDPNKTGLLTIGRIGEHNAVTWEQRLTP